MKTEDIKKAIRTKRKKEVLTASDFLSTGSTLLNLACTGFPNRGFAMGHYYFVVGDSISGKTWLTLTCLAEASINPNFDKHRFIFDNTEDGALMDIKRFFGEKVFNRIEWPGQLPSITVEDFYFNVDDALKRGEPFIYIMDSMDSLSSKAEMVKFDKLKSARRTGKETTGTMTDGKAKVNSAMLRRVIGDRLKNSKSILIIINQTRDKMNAGPFEEKKTRSGGHSLKFYASLEMWSSVKEQIWKVVRGKKRQIGIQCKIKVKKNRFTGKERIVTIPIYHSMKTKEGSFHGGIDDVGSCIDYLLEECHWKVVKGIIKAKEFNFKGSKNKLIRIIEHKGYEKDLQGLVGDVWQEIEDDCTISRKQRYL